MAVGVRALVTCVCMIAVPVAAMPVDSLTKAREDQLTSEAARVAAGLVGVFGQASYIATAMGQMYNASAVAQPGEPALHMYEAYGEAVYFLFSKSPAAFSASVVALRDPAVVAAAGAEDQLCDVDGYLFGRLVAAVFNDATTGNYTGCDESSVLNACTPGAVQINRLGGDDSPTPGRMITKYLTIPCQALATSASLWLALPGSLTGMDAGIRKPQWNPSHTVVNKGPSQDVFRTLRFPVVGPDHAPFGAYGDVSIQINTVFKATDQNFANETPLDILIAAAAASPHDDVLMLFSAARELVATSDPKVEGYDDAGHIKLHQADNGTAVGSRIAGIASDTFGKHCTATACDWSGVETLCTIDDDIVAFAELEDPAAEGLGLLLAIAVPKAEMLVRQLGS